MKSVRGSKGSPRATWRAIASEEEKKPSVAPSGAARATASAATLPAWPGRLVISTVRPPRRSRSASDDGDSRGFSATGRTDGALMS